MDNKLQKRKSTHLSNYDYGKTGVYFVTICTQDRKHILSTIVGELHSVVRAFKSLTSRECKKRFGVEKLFQRSYSDHIIRNREDCEEHLKYIRENPMRWYYRENKAN